MFSVIINHISVITSTGQANTGSGIIKAIRPPLSPGLPRVQISVTLQPEMSAGSLCLWLVLAFRHGCVTPLAVPYHGGTEGRPESPDSIINAASVKQEARLHLKDGPAVAPKKKPPQFMLDLFNAVSVSHDNPKSQKEILEGRIVRSFEDKGTK